MKFLSHSLLYVFFFLLSISFHFFLSSFYFFFLSPFKCSSVHVYVIDVSFNAMLSLLLLRLSCNMYGFPNMFPSSIDCDDRVLLLFSISLHFILLYSFVDCCLGFFLHESSMKSPSLLFSFLSRCLAIINFKRFYFISNILRFFFFFLFVAWIQHKPLSYSFFTSINSNALHFTVCTVSENNKTNWIQSEKFGWSSNVLTNRDTTVYIEQWTVNSVRAMVWPTKRKNKNKINNMMKC